MLETISAHQIKLTNNCPFTVWPGLLGNSGESTPQNGGLSLAQGAVHNFQVPNGWGGRIWGRTECDGSGHCVTGDCGKLNKRRTFYYCILFLTLISNKIIFSKILI